MKEAETQKNTGKRGETMRNYKNPWKRFKTFEIYETLAGKRGNNTEPQRWKTHKHKRKRANDEKDEPVYGTVYFYRAHGVHCPIEELLEHGKIFLSATED